MNEQKNKGGRPRVEPHRCSQCNYTTKNTTDLKRHYLTNHATEEELVVAPFYCKYCQFAETAKSRYEKHLTSKKHQRMVELVEEVIQNS